MLLPPPIPAPLSLPSIFQDPTSTHTRHLHTANAARARLRTVLKAAAAAKHPAAADWVAASRATSEYIPFLYAILAGVEADELLLPHEPIFSWRTTLSTQLLKTRRPRISLPSLHYELSILLLTHALCLSNHASSLITSLGTYETSRSVSSSDLKVHDETVNTAAALLCQASGVLLYLAEVVIPRWEAAVGEGVRGRPVELTSDVVVALSKIALADANLLGIRRLLSRSVASSNSSSSTTSTPGPPLSSSHPSPSLLSKLHFNISSLYSASLSLLQTSSSSSSSSANSNNNSSNSVGDLLPSLRRYVTDGHLVALSLGYKWLGIDCGENGGRAKAGEAVAWLGMAREGLEKVREGNKGIRGVRNGIKGLRIGIGKGKGKDEGGRERKGRLEIELEGVETFLSAYKRVNDSLHFQPLPPPTTLQSQIPAGRSILSVKPFSPPPVAFPLRKSANGARERAVGMGTGWEGLEEDLGRMEMEDGDGDGVSADEEEEGEVGGGGGGGGDSYFGSGSYW